MDSNNYLDKNIVFYSLSKSDPNKAKNGIRVFSILVKNKKNFYLPCRLFKFFKVIHLILINSINENLIC